ncbi:MAG: flavin reductase family protein [Pirellulaceae bacterium]
MSEFVVQAESIFRSLNREVWVVTSSTAEARGGLLATWVSQASLDPEKPVLLAGLAPNHHTTRLVQESGILAAHLLTQDQQELAWNFARDSGRTRDKLAACELAESDSGIPILQACHSILVGSVFAKVETGDRVYFWADIIEAQCHSNSSPLCEQEFIRWCDDSKKLILKKDKQGDVALQREGQNEFRQSLPSWLQFDGS